MLYTRKVAASADIFAMRVVAAFRLCGFATTRILAWTVCLRRQRTWVMRQRAVDIRRFEGIWCTARYGLLVHSREHVRVAVRVAERHVRTGQVAAEEVLVVEVSVRVVYRARGGVGSLLWRLRCRYWRVRGVEVLAADRWEGGHYGLAVAREAIGLHGPCGGQGRRVSGRLWHKMVV